MLRLTRLFREMAPELQLEYVPLLFTRTILGPQGGFAGEERLVKLDVARKYIEAGHAVTPTEELRRGLWCFNPDTDRYDCFIERTEEFLDFAARKRQWLDVYWRVNTGYLLFGRQSWGQGYLLNCPLRKKDIAQKLWEQYKVRVDPRLIEFREKDRRTGIQELGHNWCWLYLPGAEELGIGREVYDNKRVKPQMGMLGKPRSLVMQLPRRLLMPPFALQEMVRTVHSTPLLFDKTTKRNAEEEDKEEMERERQLRERFSQKIVQAMPQYSSQQAGNCSGGTCGPTPPEATKQMSRLLFFTFALMTLLLLSQLADVDSPINIMKNIPWWQLPPSSVAYYMLLRTLLPFKEQKRLKEEYETLSRLNPKLTFDQFFVQHYPDVFHGYRTQQQDIVAAVAACVVFANNNSNLSMTIARAAGSARDIRASVDNIMEALRRQYPNVFQSTVPQTPTLTVSQ